MQAKTLESKVMNGDCEGSKRGPTKKQQKGVVNISKTETQPKRNENKARDINRSDKQQKQAMRGKVVILGQLHTRPHLTLADPFRILRHICRLVSGTEPNGEANPGGVGKH